MKYIEKLKEFEGSNGNIESLKKQFEDIANYFLTQGYFLVNDQRKIYICDVEFYYHEEEGDIKDWIMYHRDKYLNNQKVLSPKFLEIGQFYSHSSGIDITFEDNKEKKYRASMLIRGFRIEDRDEVKNKYDYPAYPKKSDEYDPRSTFFYDALFRYGNIENGISISWKLNDKSLEGYSIETATRKNVCKYESENKKTNIPCDLKWRFFLKKQTV